LKNAVTDQTGVTTTASSYPKSGVTGIIAKNGIFKLSLSPLSKTQKHYRTHLLYSLQKKAHYRTGYFLFESKEMPEQLFLRMS